MVTMLAALLCAWPTHSGDAGCLEIARQDLRLALGIRIAQVSLKIEPGPKESFTITPHGDKVDIVGGDAVGAMYGAFEFAERVKNDPVDAWKHPVHQSPYIPDRGLNLFLTLPWNYEKNDTEYDPWAMMSPNRWWFKSNAYWSELLDQMAHSRLNWLDIHGMWDISVTDAPNLYAYFIQSPKFPNVGVPPQVKADNLRKLNAIIDMAHDRGIRVSLMAYQADLRTPDNRNPPYKNDEATIYDYTRDVVEGMIRQAPALDAIGFRIGESGKSESFFKCYGEAVKRSGRDIPLITRSWITRRQKVLPLARASNDFTVEVKYNGEQWGAPYPVAGGRMANWGSYSYEDYFSDAGSPEKNAKTWPGWPAEGGGSWPSEPYKVVWQVRANGTHRIFPFYNPGWVRNSILAMKIGTASGYTVEGEDAYYPKSPAYYMRGVKERDTDWVFTRDEMYWRTWGRLGYDPTTPDSVFDARIKRWFGPKGQEVADLWKQASVFVPFAYMAHALGPDHRDHAPELETGGSTQAYIDVDPLDPLRFRPLKEPWSDGRIGLPTVGYMLSDVSPMIRARIEKLKDEDISPEEVGRFRELRSEMLMECDLADFYAARILGAKELAASDAANGPPTSEARDYAKAAAKAWARLSDSPEAKLYRPFTEKLRMHTNDFSWKDQLAAIQKEADAMNAVAPYHDGPPPKPLVLPKTRKLEWRDEKGTLICSVDAQGLTGASLLVKPLPSSTMFHQVAMSKVGKTFQVRFPRENWGYCIAAELANGDGKVRIPSLEDRAPYLVVPAKSGPTPQIYATNEAMTYLDPKILDPSKFGALLLCPRANQFFNGFDKATRRKLLVGVERGMNLLILQQDFASGRYKLDFLPDAPKVEANQNPGLFDAGGALGLPKIETNDILWQRFVASPGWEVLGNGGVAHRKIGKGNVWIVMGRLMQRSTYKDTAEVQGKAIQAAARNLPVVLIDAGTEGAVYTTSFWPDLMNSLGIPFLTLGEAIAKEQGMNSFDPIVGPSSDDDILGGQGAAMANRFLKSQVEKMSARPTPASTALFEPERERRRKELMKSLGLDPMPAKTPLNAKVTGILVRDGYRIEKVVFESRPHFYVTAHVYVPRAVGTISPGNRPASFVRVGSQRYPVIMNVNGHWAHKKDEDRIQLRCAFQALQGYVAMAIDSPGWSFEGDSLIERRAEGDHNDFKLIEGGTNATGYYVWDAIRALDYLETRDDVDMTRVGLTGASGGGLATLYAFAADSRYKAAVPVVYMSSMELAPDNGCLCNHVPGTCLVGDRSDVVGIQAPKPVLLMGAQNDGEFPPDAMRLTHKKMAETWDLFGKRNDVYVEIFPGGHDYSKPMRETMIGFFNRYVRGDGDGQPVPEPNLHVFDPEDRSLLAADPPVSGERTMRDLSKEYLANAPAKVPAATVIGLNGGLPVGGDLKYRELDTSGPKRRVTFESESGFVTPGVLFLPNGKPRGVRIVAADAGKAAEIEAYSEKGDGFATFYIDILGTGELAEMEMRYLVYMGRSVSFTGGWQVARAAEAMRRYSNHIEVVGRGPVASQAAMYAGLMDKKLAKVTGFDCLREWSSVFESAVSDYAVQPRAHLCGSLANLRSQVKHSEWH